MTTLDDVLAFYWRLFDNFYRGLASWWQMLSSKQICTLFRKFIVAILVELTFLQFGQTCLPSTILRILKDAKNNWKFALKYAWHLIECFKSYERFLQIIVLVYHLFYYLQILSDFWWFPPKTPICKSIWTPKYGNFICLSLKGWIFSNIVEREDLKCLPHESYEHFKCYFYMLWQNWEKWRFFILFFAIKKVFHLLVKLSFQIPGAFFHLFGSKMNRLNWSIVRNSASEQQTSKRIRFKRHLNLFKKRV